MRINFSKYHGTGNDFILIDDRKRKFDVNNDKLIKKICERRFGIGGDGLILLRSHSCYDFEMIFFNSTGERSTFCGNGGRCILSFANDLGIINKKSKFIAYDGTHEGEINSNDVKLKMSDVNEITFDKRNVILDTGSPHLVKFVKDIKTIDILKKGRELRFDKKFGEYGINVNFVQIGDRISIRTYERGDEMESLSCGTGSVATAIALYETGKSNDRNTIIHTSGGRLTVSFDYKNNHYTNIWLSGEANMVYSGYFKC